MGWSNWKSKTGRKELEQKTQIKMIPRDKEAPSVTGWNQYVCTYCFSVRDRVAIVPNLLKVSGNPLFLNHAWNLHQRCHHCCSADTALAAKDVANNCRQIHFSPLSPFIISRCFLLAESNWSPADKWDKDMQFSSFHSSYYTLQSK